MDTNKNFDDHLQQRLDERKSGGLLRTLLYADDKIDFSSNDYFGFSKSASLKHIETGTYSSGATGSRSITGNSKVAEETERMIAAFHNSEAALIFNSGYMANVGLFSCIANKGDCFISDEYIHASIIDGMRLSHANRINSNTTILLILKKNYSNQQEKKSLQLNQSIQWMEMKLR